MTGQAGSRGQAGSHHQADDANINVQFKAQQKAVEARDSRLLLDLQVSKMHTQNAAGGFLSDIHPRQRSDLDA